MALFFPAIWGNLPLRNEVENVLRLLSHALPPQRLLPLQLPDRLLLARPQRIRIHFPDAGQRALGPRGRFRPGLFSRAEELEAGDVGEGDDVVVSWLRGEGGGGVGGCGSAVEGDGVGDVAGGEKGAFESAVGGSYGYADAEGC